MASDSLDQKYFINGLCFNNLYLVFVMLRRNFVRTCTCHSIELITILLYSETFHKHLQNISIKIYLRNSSFIRKKVADFSLLLFYKKSRIKFIVKYLTTIKETWKPLVLPRTLEYTVLHFIKRWNFLIYFNFIISRWIVPFSRRISWTYCSVFSMEYRISKNIKTLHWGFFFRKMF